MAERRQELLDSLDEANKLLMEKVEGIAKEKALKSESDEPTTPRGNILGFTVTAGGATVAPAELARGYASFEDLFIARTEEVA